MSHSALVAVSVAVAAAAVLGVILVRSAMTQREANSDAGAEPVAAAAEPFSPEFPARSPESQARKLRVGDDERSYVLHVPANLDHNNPAPLVLVFHGRLGTGQLMEQMTGFSEMANQGFIVAYPDGIGRSWNAGHGVGLAESEGVDDVGFIARLIDALSAEFKIDPRRIYAAGMSNGGMFAYRLACELKGRIAAVASVAGPLPPQIADHCNQAGPLSILHIHGTADRIVPWEGGETSSGGKILSVDATMHLWAGAQKCSEQSVITFSKGNVSCQSYSNCSTGAAVSLCRVEGGGHTWPGSQPAGILEAVVGPTNQDVNATAMIWTFFEQHKVAAGPTASVLGPLTESSVSQPATLPQIAEAGAEDAPKLE